MSTTVHNPCDLNSQVIRSDALKRVMGLVEQVACHPAAVLIVGETGTGKEMIARSIHSHSLRCNNPMVDVNCAAIPEHLVESELFGYEKGAFSGADAQKSAFLKWPMAAPCSWTKLATLIPKSRSSSCAFLMAYLLPPGRKQKISVNVRVVAATNQDLEKWSVPAVSAMTLSPAGGIQAEFRPCASGRKICWRSPSRFSTSTTRIQSFTSDAVTALLTL